MLAAAARSAARASRGRATAAAKRFSSSSSHEEEVKQMGLWRTVTFAAVPGCIAFSIYSLANEHPHEGDKPDREYTNVRNKPFPWGEKPLFHPGDHHKEH